MGKKHILRMFQWSRGLQSKGTLTSLLTEFISVKMMIVLEINGE